MNVLIYGNESFLLNQALQKKIKELVHVQDTMNTVFYDASSSTFSMLKVIEEAQTLPFFSEHKVLVIQNCLFLTRGVSLKDQELNELMTHLARPVETCTLIFMHDNDNLDTQKKITKNLNGCHFGTFFNHKLNEPNVLFQKNDFLLMDLTN